MGGGSTTLHAVLVVSGYEAVGKLTVDLCYSVLPDSLVVAVV